MRFLARLWRRYIGTSQPTGSAEPAHAAFEELLARFLTSRSHFAATKGVVKLGAFLPAPDGTLSVFAIQGLTEPDIWELGVRVVGAPTGRTIRARADFESNRVHPPLRVVPDDIPPRHRTLADWPVEPSERQELALELANAARLMLR